MFNRELDEDIARNMTAEHGTPYTPADVARLRHSGFAKIREGLRARGIACPDTDEGLFVFLGRFPLRWPK